MNEFTDQMNRTMHLPAAPKRIISLVPSQTELLYDLGLRDEVVGITRFCIHPESWFQSKPKVGGTKKINFEKIEDLHPDLIIGNKEENDSEQVKELMKNFPVWMSDVKNLDDAFRMILQVGEITGKANEAGQLKNEIEKKFQRLSEVISGSLTESGSGSSPLNAVYLIWHKPNMVAGCDTFIHNMLSRCGFQNCFQHARRYPELSDDEIKKASPGLILLSSEPFPFSEKHIAIFRNLCPESNVMLVDGELFSWYGSRLLKSPDYFLHLVERIKAGD